MHHRDAQENFEPTLVPGIGYAANVVPFRLPSEEDRRSTEEEAAWSEFLRLTREMVKAQNVMHDAHQRYLSIKYPRGVPK